MFLTLAPSIADQKHVRRQQQPWWNVHVIGIELREFIKSNRLQHLNNFLCTTASTVYLSHYSCFTTTIVTMSSVVDKVKEMTSSGPLKPGSKLPTNVGSLKENHPTEGAIDLGQLKGKSKCETTISPENYEEI